MQTSITKEFLNTRAGQEADSILRKCVHCGFCTATCPTYQLLNDELDGPRGRIYQIKQMLEGHEVTDKTRTHLDRCLTCRNCETTCPSGVEYGKLLDIGRVEVEKRTTRPFKERLIRLLLDRLLTNRILSSALFTVARVLRPILPKQLAKKIIKRQSHLPVPDTDSKRMMLVLDGCVQPNLTPRTNQAARIILGRAGIKLVSVAKANCCGALSHHLSFKQRAEQIVRNNIDAWWPHIESGAEAIVVTASGCGVMLKDYGHVLLDDPDYAAKAKTISAMTMDLSEVITKELTKVDNIGKGRRISFHAPCTYQHGLGLSGTAENLLEKAGYELCPVANPHLCCGSAGSYSLLQPEISGSLLKNKLVDLTSDSPELIATANVGCQTHLLTRSKIPVVHWIELLV